MDGTFLRICGIGVLCAISGFVLRRQGSEFSSLIRLCGGLLMVGALVIWFSDLPSQITSLLEEADLLEYASLMLKALGLAILSSVCADVCRECGAPQIASGVECAGNLAILFLCLPLLRELLLDAEALLEWG